MPILRPDDVIDSWEVVLPDCAHLGSQYLVDVSNAVIRQEIPVVMEFQQAATGLIKAAIGRTRTFLVMTPQARSLDPFRLLHYAVPVGRALSIGWYLAGRVPGLGSPAAIRLPVLHGLDLFANADLHALTAVVHNVCVLETVEQFALSVSLDLETISRRSFGLFGVG